MFHLLTLESTWTGIFLYEGCPTSGGICIGNYTSSTSSKTLAYTGTNQTSGTTISLTSGVTYYLVIDTYPTPNSPCSGTITINGTLNVPCSGIPDPGNTISTNGSPCPGVNFTLSLQNFTSGSGVTYQWQLSLTGNDPWTNLELHPLKPLLKLLQPITAARLPVAAIRGLQTLFWLVILPPFNPGFRNCGYQLNTLRRRYDRMDIR